MATPTTAVMLPNQTDVAPGEGLKDGQSLATIMQWTMSGFLIPTTVAGQANAAAPVLNARINRVAAVAAANDPVQLPFAVPGLQVIVLNDDAANALKVYPNAGANPFNGGVVDTMVNNAGGASLSSTINAQASISYYCYKPGVWKSTN